MNVYVGSRAGKTIAGIILLPALLSACASAGSPADAQMSLLPRSHELLAMGRLPEALRLTGRAISLDGPTPFLLNQMALIRVREGHPKMALRVLTHATRLYPHSTILTLNLATEQLVSRQPALARATLRPILARGTWPNGFRTLMGRIDLDTGHLAESGLFLHEALDRHPGNPLLLATMGLLHQRMGQEHEAREDFRKALVHAPPGPLRTRLYALLEPHE